MFIGDRNRRFVLRERPSGRIGPNTFELTEEPIPEIAISASWAFWVPLWWATTHAWRHSVSPNGSGEVLKCVHVSHPSSW